MRITKILIVSLGCSPLDPMKTPTTSMNSQTSLVKFIKKIKKKVFLLHFQHPGTLCFTPSANSPMTSY